MIFEVYFSILATLIHGGEIFFEYFAQPRGIKLKDSIQKTSLVSVHASFCPKFRLVPY